MKIYVAGRFSRIKELRTFAAAAEGCGHVVTSRWLKGGHEETGDPGEAARFAREDIDDVLAAEVLVVFTEGRCETRGGHHVEFGIALAQYKIILLVGEPTNVFHHLNCVTQYPDAQSCLNQLRLLPREKEAAWTVNV